MPIINTFKTRRKNASVLFLTFLILSLFHSPSNAATLSFSDGIESGNLSKYNLQTSGGKVTVATSPIASGKYSANFDLYRNSLSSNYDRAEAVIRNGYSNFEFGKEYWFSYRYIFTNWADDKDSEMAPFQIHVRPSSWSCSPGTAWSNAPFFMHTGAGYMGFTTYKGVNRWKAPVQKNKWMTIAVRFIPSYGSNGLIEAWHNGTKIASVSGANSPKYDKCGKLMQAPYLKIGVYKWNWKAGRPATQSNRRTLFVDNIKIAQGSNGLSLVNSTTSSSSSTSTTSSTSSTSTSSSTMEDVLAYWPMNTGTSTTTPDASGNGYTGTLVNGARITSSGTLLLDGVNDYATVGKPNVTGNAMTISAWFWADDMANCPYSDCRIISKAIGLAEQEHDFMISTIKVGSDTRLRFRLNTNGATSTLNASSGNLQNKEWVHVAAVYDGNAMRLYKDGVLVGSRAKTGNITLRNTGSTWIGGNPPSATARSWQGQIDDVAIFNYALTASEIAELAK